MEYNTICISQVECLQTELEKLRKENEVLKFMLKVVSIKNLVSQVDVCSRDHDQNDEGSRSERADLKVSPPTLETSSTTQAYATTSFKDQALVWKLYNNNSVIPLFLFLFFLMKNLDAMCFSGWNCKDGEGWI